jgi:response regulator of citrate/malate metabolism
MKCRRCVVTLDLQRLQRLFEKRRNRTWTEGKCWNWPANSLDRSGYGVLTYKVGEKLKHVLAHRLSYALHNEAIQNGLQVRHDCDNPRCVNPEHLRLGTQLQNEDDKRQRGRLPRGEAKGADKLTAELVVEIREGYASLLSIQELAILYGVSRALIRKVVLRQIWTHVD